MPEYSDIYVLTNKRSPQSAKDFLDKFIPVREKSADEYEIPQYSNSPEKVFTQDYEIIEYCCNHLDIDYSIYWRSTNNSKPEYGMLFYLKDGNVICGLSTDASDQKYVTELLKNMKKYLNTELGYVAHEASPDVENIEGFKKQIELHKS